MSKTDSADLENLQPPAIEPSSWSASSSLLASPLMRRAKEIVAAVPATTSPEAMPAIENLAQVIDLSLRLGWSKRQLEIDKVGAAAAAALSERRISDAEYEALREAQARRRADIRHRGQMHALRFGAPRRPRYDHGVARRGRTDQISLRLLPKEVRDLLTPGQIAVATTYAEDFIIKGFTDDAKARIAYRSHTCDRVAQLAQAVLFEARCIKITKRSLPGRRGYSTVVEIIDPRWLRWLRNRRARPRSAQKGARPFCEHVPIDLRRDKKEASNEMRSSDPIPWDDGPTESR
jgi:hypothetical protein